MSPGPVPEVNNAPSELPPAIPAMISKAKVLLKKKLNAGEVGKLRSQSLPLQDEYSASDSEEEWLELPRPDVVEELEKVTRDVRSRVRTPEILYSRTALRQALQDWIPVLQAAVIACAHLQSSSPSREMNFKALLEEEMLCDVCLLAKMCFEIGVYGPTGTETVKSWRREHVSDVTREFSRDSNKSTRDLVDTPRDHNECTRDEDKSSDSRGQNITTHGISLSPDDHFQSGPLGSLDSSQRSKEEAQTPSKGRVLLDAESVPQEERTEKNLKSLSETSIRHGDLRSVAGLHEEELQARGKERSGNDLRLASSKDVLSDSSVPPVRRTHNTGVDDKTTTGICTAYSRKSPFNMSSPLGSALSRLARQVESKNLVDCRRAQFVGQYFSLLKVEQIRRTLRLSRGFKRQTWCVLLHCIEESLEPDAVSKHISGNDVTRALRVLYDGIDEYRDALLHHLVSAFELDGRETMVTCARIFPDVYPWEVMEICRGRMSRDPLTSAQCFVYYLEQLMRWRAEVGEKRTQTIATICEEEEVMQTWFHSALIASEPTGQRHCTCGMPRNDSHRLPWKHEDHLRRVMDVVCQRSQLAEKAKYIDMCWKHGYWLGCVTLCVAAGMRHLALQVVVFLGDMALLDPSQSWGSLPKTLTEWRYLLTLLSSVPHRHSGPGEDDEDQCACPRKADHDWSTDLCWENVIQLALRRLGAGHTVQLLKDVPYSGKALPTDFYYKCIMGIVIEREQGKLVHEMLRKLDSYLWSKRAGALTPELNYLRLEEQMTQPLVKEDSSSSVKSLSRVKTLEDAATNWGVNIHLAEAECPVCSLPLCEQVSTSNQGLLVFECSHVFHKFCVPERACVVCFHQNLKTLGDM